MQPGQLASSAQPASRKFAKKWTHYALVVLHPATDRSGSVIVSGPRVNVAASYEVQDTYLIPRDSVNHLFGPADRKRDGQPGKRMERYAAVEELDAFRLAATGITPAD